MSGFAKAALRIAAASFCGALAEQKI